MLQQIAFRLGRAFGSLPMIARLVVVSGIVGGIWYWSAQPSATEIRERDTATLIRVRDAQAKAILASQQQREQDVCRESIEAKKREYSVALAGRKYWDASLVLRNCAELLADAELLKLVADAEVQSHLQTINDTKMSPRERAQAIVLLERDAPAAAKPFTQLRARLLTQAEQSERAAEAAKRRKEGVSLGMTAEDVLASSWGKPKSVNRTTYTFGTHEQWVYGSRSYLYFENGVLTAIQN